MKLRDDMHVLTGSYALDALDDPEYRDFERHLQHCASCQAEIRGLRETAARLALAAAVEPPPQMQPRLLAAARRTRQLPPLPARRTRQLPPLSTHSHRLLRLPRISQLSRLPRLPQLAAVAAVACLAVAFGLGLAQVATQHRLDSVRAASAAITRVITAADARTTTTRSIVGGTVTVVASASQHAAVVTAAGMPSLPASQVYQVWVITPSGARSAGLLPHTTRTGPLLAPAARPGDQIGITVEPSGGTTTPTTTPLVLVPLTI